MKAFEIKSFSFGAKNKATVGSQSGGAGAGRAELNEFKVAKLTDNGSPKLFGAFVSATPPIRDSYCATVCVESQTKNC